MSAGFRNEIRILRRTAVICAGIRGASPYLKGKQSNMRGNSRNMASRKPKMRTTLHRTPGNLPNRQCSLQKMQSRLPMMKGNLQYREKQIRIHLLQIAEDARQLAEHEKAA